MSFINGYFCENLRCPLFLRMKTLLSIFLTFVFLYSIVGFYLNFVMEQCMIKKEIKEKILKKLPENELTVIKISFENREKIIWEEEGKEFRFGGCMYDVVKIRQVYDTTFYYCFCDVKESRLLTKLDKLVRDQSDHSSSRTYQKKHPITLYFQNVLHVKCFFEAPVRYFSYTASYNFSFIDVLTPPPRVLNTI
jgi:hypothetical protein